MAASVHNFILSYNELNIIQGMLKERATTVTDKNSVNELLALSEKLREQRDCGYPAKDYPFWRNYFIGDGNENE